MFPDESRWEQIAKRFNQTKRRAKFIAFEGIDGSGKSTIIDDVKDELMRRGFSVLINREPGTTEMGDKLRALLKSDVPRSKRTELFIQEACRVDIIERRILPNLHKYDYILNDRYIDSTVAYQGAGNGNDQGLINELNILATRDIKPDLTFFIDTDFEIARARVLKRKGVKDDFDKDREYAKRVYNAYHRLCNRSDIITINNNDNIEFATKAIIGYLSKLEFDWV